MHLSRITPSIVREDRVADQGRKPATTEFGALLNGEIGTKTKSAGQTPSVPEIMPRGTPNNLLKSGDMLDMGGGVYYNTAERNYQDKAGSIVGTNPAAVQQYTDPETYLASGAAYQPSDKHLEETMPNLDELVPKGMGSPTFILNARWAYEQTWGKPPLTVVGDPAWQHQADPVALMAFPGVLEAPGPPPLAGALPESTGVSYKIPDMGSAAAAAARSAPGPFQYLWKGADSTRVLLAAHVSSRSDTLL